MKTKKSTLLSLATAAAIVATTFGTYAVWDQMDATAEGTAKIASPSVAVTAENITLTPNDVIGNNSIEYTGTATFNITGKDKLDNLKLTPEVTVAGADLTTGDYSVEITQTSDSGFTGDATLGYTDTNLDATNAYTVKVTINNKDLADKDMTVNVIGVATPKAAN